MTRPAALLPDAGCPDIIEFTTSPCFLNKSLSVLQSAILKAAYMGQPGNEHLRLTDDERIALARATEGRPVNPKGYDEMVIVGGIRSGKTDRLGATSMVYEAVRWGPTLEGLLAPGQTAKVILVAQDERGVGEMQAYIEGNLGQLEEPACGHGCHWPGGVLKKSVGQARAIVGEEVRTVWPVVFKVYPPKTGAMRAATALAGELDELGHWETGEGAHNQDKKIVRAFRGRFATLARLKPKKWMISSPNEEEGVLWEEFKSRGSSRALVVQAATWELHPPGSSPTAPTQEFLDAQQEKDPEAFLKEYAAQFAKPGGGNVFLDARAIDRNTTKGVTRRQPEPGNEHEAWLDAAFKRDRFSMSIAHAQRTGDRKKVVQDACRHWTPKKASRGSKPTPLDDVEIVNEIVNDFLRPFGIDRIYGDQHSDVHLEKLFRAHGITFVMVAATKSEKFEAYKNLRAALNADLVELLDDEITIRDLKVLVRKETPDGYTVQAPKRRSAYDDASTPVSRLVKKLLPLTDGLDLAGVNAQGAPKRAFPGLDWRQPPGDDDFHGRIMEAIY